MYLLIKSIERVLTVPCKLRDLLYHSGLERIGRGLPRSLLATACLAIALPLLVLEMVVFYPLLSVLARLRIRFYGTHVRRTEAGFLLEDRRRSTSASIPWPSVRQIELCESPIESWLHLTLSGGEVLSANSFEPGLVEYLQERSKVPFRYEIA